MNEAGVKAILKESRVVPVAVFNNVADALKTAEILLNNTIPVLEITLRTREALECLEAVRNRFPELALGAGSVLCPEDLRKAHDSGAQFAVSPCCDTAILQSAVKDMCYIPGVTTPSEMQTALKYSQIVKVFPSQVLGGTAYLKAMLAPFHQKECYIIPTGGITQNHFAGYFSLPNVLACGMSGIVDAKLIADRNFAELTSRIRSIKKEIECLPS